MTRSDVLNMCMVLGYRSMKDQWFSICIICLLNIEFCSSLVQSQSLLDYETICKHHFSLGCPVYDHYSWRCAKYLTNCSGDQFNRYHCVLNSTGQPFKVIHTCAPILRCDKGTIPIYNKGKDIISCEPCRDGYYQPRDTWSDETSECLERHTCEEEGHKIECNMDTGLHNIQDVYCRCDARKGYVLAHFEIRGMCVQWVSASCDHDPCPRGQERLLNYSCASLCPHGQERDDNDMCVPISLMNLTTPPAIDNRTMSGKATPRTTVETTLTTTVTTEESTTDNNIAFKIASAVIALVVILVIVLLIIVCRKYQLYKKCTRSRRNRKQSHKGRRPVDNHYHYHKPKIYEIKAELVQFGDSNQVTSYKVSANASENSLSSLQLGISPRTGTHH